jgi:nitrogen fixation/metabolism regulation signal transduction histidine kinase
MRAGLLYLLFSLSLFASTSEQADVEDSTLLLIFLISLILILLLVSLIKLSQEVHQRKILEKELDRFKHELEDHIQEDIEHNKQYQ